jgi:predicted transcriptional regulator of viral defense system
VTVLEAGLTFRERLYEVALEQNGYVTSADAAALGIERDQLRKLSSGSGLTRIGHGLYRFDAMPVSATDEYMEAVLRVGHRAYLNRQSVLAMHSLGLVNPRFVYVGTPRRTRRQLPDTVKMEWRTLPAEDMTVYDGIPSATVHRALLDCAPIIMSDRFDDAVAKAHDEGLLAAREVDDILVKVKP